MISISISIMTLMAAAQPAHSDLPQLAHEIHAQLNAHHFNPKVLESEDYLAIQGQVEALAQSASDQDEFVRGFNAIWREGPFSHVNLAPAPAPADEFALFLDDMRVGGGGAQLAWPEDRTAHLHVRTMMGLDTIEEIEAAYDTIAEQGADRLIIDVRGNTGGAFAVRPLVEHVISEPMDAGVFVSQPWFDAHDRAPTLSDAEGVEPWTGWSISAFWADVQTASVTRIQFEPAQSRFEGPVCVLTDQVTASAAEMAVAALSSLPNVTVIGEPTAGQMLSQSPFDVGDGLHLFLPVADYYATGVGRIEGQGVQPDVFITPEHALAYALSSTGPCASP